MKKASSEVIINTRPTILIGDLVDQNDEANVQKQSIESRGAKSP